MNIEFFLLNRCEFTKVSREHDCEIPKGDCWRIVVKHKPTNKLYQYYEEDCYYSLEDQLSDSPSGLEINEVK